MTDRSDERRELFWKQLRRAEGDVQAWPDYVKQALIKPTQEIPAAVGEQHAARPTQAA
jgi:hypothetical protein